MSIGGLMTMKIYVNFVNQGRIKMKILIKNDKGDIEEWEEIPDEELWEDGELSNVEVQQKIISHTMQKGDWILIREVDNGED